MKKIVLTGGGTGGHVIPNLSLLPHLKRGGYQIFYIGASGIEKDIIQNQTDVPYFEISASKFKRKSLFKNLLLPFKLMSSINKAKKALKAIGPDIVFSKGGYVSVPVVIAAKKLHLPIVSHESDFSLGLANKIIYKCCNIMCTSFKQTAQNLKKGLFTGAPVRDQLFAGSKEKAQNVVNINKSKPTLLVMGGSTGAMALNKILEQSLKKLTPHFNVIHLVGKGKGNKSIKCENYFSLEYVQNIEHLFALADLVISRSGSNAIFELLALKKPMILIPLPKMASRGDQIENAKEFEKLGYAKVLNQQTLSPEQLFDAVISLNVSKNNYINAMKKADFVNGSKNIYYAIEKCYNQAKLN